jgi:hypothetical protein
MGVFRRFHRDEPRRDNGRPAGFGPRPASALIATDGLSFLP